ncbi:MAG: hypothetical protein ACYTHJ_14525 [Planctomycetota bacterium]|jgi:hypothetical protein
MSFVSGSVSFRRFYIQGKCPRKIDEEWVQQFASHAFGQHGVTSSDGIEIGWISPEHILDTDFGDLHRVVKGPFLHLAMRIDRTAPPASLVKAYRLMEERAALADSGREFLSKQDRRLAREAAMRRAEKEARKGAFRRATSYPVLIDVADKVVYLGTMSTTAADKFMALVRDTLNVTLVPAGAEEVAYRLATTHGTKRTFEDVRPSEFVESPAGSDAAVDFQPNDRSFLGWEFLTWLWYRCDVGEGMFDLQGSRNVEVSIFKHLQLDCVFDLSGSDTIRNDAPAGTPEARAALAIGKTPRKFGMVVAGSEGEWQLSLDGPNYSISTLTIAQLEDEKDAGALAEYRFRQMQSVARTIDALYAEFIRLRLGEAWKQELSAIRHWIATLSTKSLRRVPA